ncbi:MAG: FxsA family protein, partial [Luminiphilus sp.]|nr:FxsA family protein [Luminiphilus sp.]
LREHLLVGDVALLVSGLLLIIPGLISDAVAVMVLIAPLRALLVRLLITNAVPSARYRDDQARQRDFQQGAHRAPGSNGGVTLEGEYQPVSPDTEPLAPLEHDQTDRR